MHRSIKQKLFAGAAVVAILVGGTVAAVSGGSGAAREKRGPLVTAAGYLGVSTSQLSRELQSGRSLGQIANATSGKSSAGLVSVLLAAAKERLAAAQANLPKRVNALVNHVREPGQRAAAARYLGLRPVQLASELRSGKTLAQIANATPGRSAAGLIEAIVAARRSVLAARVAAGTITQAQANVRLAHLTSRVTAAVNRARARG
ncbi:MAG TPA: hypothetical protein VNZ01_08720 [Solirubrobacteraceae bacterium]|jgi:hypothetical protein|nr:hypothetical protein [Solirubrobacteraceae bacterium]